MLLFFRVLEMVYHLELLSQHQKLQVLWLKRYNLIHLVETLFALLVDMQYSKLLKRNNAKSIVLRLAHT